MKYKITDEKGNDIICDMSHEIDNMHRAYDAQYKEMTELRADITKLQDMVVSQTILIDNLKECIIQLQSETISVQNSTLLDIIKNTFTKKKNSNITHSTVEIND